MHPDAPARRITTWLAILGYTLVASGLPLPLGHGIASDGRVSTSGKRLSVKDRSRPFPCMDRPCGCDTVDRCFTSCCCHTPAETLAWALSHDVEPGVLAALQRRVDGASRPSVTTHVSVPTRKPSCCSTATSLAEQACLATAPASAGAEILSGKVIRAGSQKPPRATECATGADPHEPPAADAPASQPRTRSVTLRAMLACGGIVAEWFIAGAALPPPRVEVSFVTLPVDEMIVADAVGAGLRIAPAAPPPRAA